MTDAIGMIEALSEWGEHLNRLEAAAKEDGIGPGDYLGNYHLAVMRVLRGLEAVEQARAAETREMFAEARAAAVSNAEQARIELNKLEEATRKMQLEANRQKLALEGAAASVIERVAEEIGKKVGDASVIRAKAYSRGQFGRRSPPASRPCCSSCLWVSVLGEPVSRWCPLRTKRRKGISWYEQQNSSHAKDPHDWLIVERLDGIGPQYVISLSGNPRRARRLAREPGTRVSAS